MGHERGGWGMRREGWVGHEERGGCGMRGGVGGA